MRYSDTSNRESKQAFTDQNRKAAMDAVGHGQRVFPVIVTRHPKNPDKKKADIPVKWRNEATTDGKQIIFATQRYLCTMALDTLGLVNVTKKRVCSLACAPFSSALTGSDYNGDSDATYTQSLYAYYVNESDGGATVCVHSTDTQDPIKSISLKSKPLAITFQKVCFLPPL